jgi:energy-coupling factor transporter ATP-binding protein EcfA2
MNDDFGATNLATYLAQIEGSSPKVEALGITDYLLVRRYEEVLAAKQLVGRLPDVGLLFCNIEMRLSIETKAGKGINLHILVSPDEQDHVEQIKRHLAKLTFHYAKDDFACSESDLIKLGRAHDPSLTDDESALRAGVNQFKVDFHQLRKLYDDTGWLRDNTLIAVAGSSNDGTAGLQDETASFAATRKEIEAFAHIIFTATPKNIEFWRGEGILSPEQLETKYGGMKPCLHGSDAHRLDKVAKPDADRYCWIKGDLTFESLRQACLEPRLRAYIGEAPPIADTPYSISKVSTPAHDWLLPSPLPINEGMVAIIGARGSGKTALADLIAHAGNSPFPTEGTQSFVTRAKPFLASARVAATWSDGGQSESRLLDAPTELPDVHYLTQQFVDRLCSSVAESDELLEEIKRVVFLAHEPESRLGADDFDSLVDIRSSETQLAVEALNQRLDRLSQDVLVERVWYHKRGDLKRDLLKAKEDLGKTDASRKNLIKPGGKDRADYYTRLSTAITEREQELQRLSRQLQSYKKLHIEIQRYQSDVFPRALQDLQRVFADTGLTEAEWADFLPAFAGNPTVLVTQKVATQEQSITATHMKSAAMPTVAMTAEQLGQCSLDALKSERAGVGEEIGADRKNIQRLQQLNQLYATQDARCRRLEEDLARAEQSPSRLAGILAERAALYERFFELITEQCDILTELYKPLAEKLVSATTSATKLRLRVIRNVDVDAWARAGESLLDLRKNGKFRGKGALADAARDALLPAWQEGSAAEVAAAMEKFRTEYDQTLIDQSAVEPGSDQYQQWAVDLGRWLYSTDHVKVQYSIEYEDVSITQLSPGTRGIVLLLLYLALDLEDSRPLIIDQPEENLDPKSVFSELVDLFRAARVRRQVIIVTHNANLVVNTDVDQVIVASCTKHESGEPPEFQYLSGGLEDPAIRGHVVDILEGGAAAFRQRAKRLRVRLN